MRAARYKYHYVTKIINREKTKIRNERMVTSLANNDMNKFYDDAQKMKKGNNHLPNCMDGEIGPKNIVKIFKDKYMNILNAVGYNSDDINLLKSDIDDLIKNEINIENINYKHIINGINKLKLDKS